MAEAEKQATARPEVVERFIRASCDRLHAEQNEALSILERLCLQLLGGELLLAHNRHSGASAGLPNVAQLPRTLALVRELLRFVDACRQRGFQIRARDFVPPSPALLRVDEELRDLSPVDRNLMREAGRRVALLLDKEFSALKAERGKDHPADGDASPIERKANNPESNPIRS